MGPFSQVPGLAGYQQQVALNDQQGNQQMMRLSQLMQMAQQSQAMRQAPEDLAMKRRMQEAQIGNYEAEAGERQSKAQKMQELFSLSKQISTLPQDHPERATLVQRYKMLADPSHAFAAPQMPKMRERIEGGRMIQEEFQPDGTFKKVGEGERFAKQIAPSFVMPREHIIQGENGPMIYSNGVATPIMGADGQAVKGKSLEKALPTSAAGKLMENQQNLRRAEQALALISGKKVGEASGDDAATGIKGYLPDAILQRTDPAGVSTRAAIGDLGSLVIHDRSGAAVTAAEFPRLRPFIPTVTDKPEVVRKKLDRFVSEYRAVVEEAADFYKQSGYKVPEGALRGSGVTEKTSAKTVTTPDGRTHTFPTEAAAAAFRKAAGL